MAKTYNGISEVIADWKNLSSPGRFYTIGNVTRDNINQLEFTLVRSKEVSGYVNEGDRKIPEELAGKGFRSWFDSATVQDIIDNKLEHSPDSTEKDLIEAIFYYAENDDFMD